MAVGIEAKADSSALFGDTLEMSIPTSLFLGKRVNFGRDNPYRLGILIPGINKALL